MPAPSTGGIPPRCRVRDGRDAFRQSIDIRRAAVIDRYNREEVMKRNWFLALLLPFFIAGCFSYTKSPPPKENTTVVVPQGTTTEPAERNTIVTPPGTTTCVAPC
jgi:hypothetical protein